MFRITLPKPGAAGGPLAEEAMVFAAGKSRALSRVAFNSERKTKQAMSAAGLGRLSKAIKSGSSANRSRFQEQSATNTGRLRRARGAPSALQNAQSQFSDKDMSWVTVKGRFKNLRQNRAFQAAEAYAQGANIRPRSRGGWLWVPTENAPKRGQRNAAGGRPKITPANWPDTWPPLQFVPTKKGALLVARVQLNSRRGKGKLGRAYKAKGKRPVKSAQAEDLFNVVMFWGIRNTYRSRRYNPRRIARQEMREYATYLNEEILSAAATLDQLELVTIG